jgi:hypothetical protein
VTDEEEKTWFFPLRGYQPKINELIFLFLLTDRLVFLLLIEVCQRLESHPEGWLWL